jgi:hypothetical protein
VSHPIKLGSLIPRRHVMADNMRADAARATESAQLISSEPAG